MKQIFMTLIFAVACKIDDDTKGQSSVQNSSQSQTITELVFQGGSSLEENVKILEQSLQSPILEQGLRKIELACGDKIKTQQELMKALNVYRDAWNKEHEMYIEIVKKLKESKDFSYCNDGSEFRKNTQTLSDPADSVVREASKISGEKKMPDCGSSALFQLTPLSANISEGIEVIYRRAEAEWLAISGLCRQSKTSTEQKPSIPEPNTSDTLPNSGLRPTEAPDVSSKTNYDIKTLEACLGGAGGVGCLKRAETKNKGDSFNEKILSDCILKSQAIDSKATQIHCMKMSKD